MLGTTHKFKGEGGGGRGGGGAGGGGLLQTWVGQMFAMQAQKGGSNNLVYVILGKNAGVKESILNSSAVTVILL